MLAAKCLLASGAIVISRPIDTIGNYALRNVILLRRKVKNQKASKSKEAKSLGLIICGIGINMDALKIGNGERKSLNATTIPVKFAVNEGADWTRIISNHSRHIQNCAII